MHLPAIFTGHSLPRIFRNYFLKDTANKATELSDFSVCTTWLIVGQRYYLLDVFRERLTYPDLKRAVMRLNDRYGPKVIVIEDKASGTSLIQDLRNSGLAKVKEYLPVSGTDKVMRLHAQTALIENGKVLFPREASWLADYLHELTTFPGTRHDDQVDSTTQVLDFINSEFGEQFRRMEVWVKLGE